MAKKSKKAMIQEMDESGWHHDCSESSSYDEVKSEYERFLDETSDDSVLYPNPRDPDAEDEDWP